MFSRGKVMSTRDVHRFINELDEATIQGLITTMEFRVVFPHWYRSSGVWITTSNLLPVSRVEGIPWFLSMGKSARPPHMLLPPEQAQRPVETDLWVPHPTGVGGNLGARGV